MSAEKFLAAYGRFTPHQSAKLLSEMQVRSVMFVHNKTCATRMRFASFKAIAEQMHEDAKQIDDKLHAWSKLGESESEAALPKPKKAH